MDISVFDTLTATESISYNGAYLRASISDSTTARDLYSSSLKFVGTTTNVVTFPLSSPLDLPAGGAGIWSMFAQLTINSNPTTNHCIINLYFDYGNNKGIIWDYAGSSSDLKQRIFFGTTVYSSTSNTPIGSACTLGVTFDGTYIRFYRNGVLDGTFSATQKVSGSMSTGYVGSEWVGGRVADANFDGVAVYKGRVLSGVEILALHNGGNPDPTSLSLYYDMGEGSGTILHDLSGNGINGTLGGTPVPVWMTSTVNVQRMPYSIETSDSTTAFENLQTYQPFTIMVPHNTRVGFNMHQHNTAQKFAIMKEAGIRQIRVDFYIYQTELVQGVFTWSAFDSIINNAHAQDIEVIALMSIHGTGGAAWAKVPASSGNGRVTPEAYVPWCAAAAAHFGTDRVYYELGNEPNLNSFWGSMPNNATEYSTDYLQPAYDAIKAVDPNCIVVSAGISPGANTYIEDMFLAGAAGHYDYFGNHPYTQPAAPTTTYMAQIQEIMWRYGDGEKQQALTEWGWSTAIGDSQAVSEATQGTYMTQLMSQIFGYTIGGKFWKTYKKYRPIVHWYDFFEDGTSPTDHESHFGVITQDLTRRKPAFFAFKEVAGTMIEETIIAEEIDVVIGGARSIYAVDSIVMTDGRKNLLSNPSFETSGDWSAVGQIVQGQFPITGTSYNRSSAGRITLASGQAGSYGNYFMQIVPVSAGETYTLSAYAYINSGTSGSLNVTFALYDWSLQVSGNAVTTQGAWTRSTKTYTVPAGQTQIRCILNTNSPIGTVYWDAAMLEKVPTAGVYFDGATGGGWDGTVDRSTSSFAYITAGLSYGGLITDTTSAVEEITVSTTVPDTYAIFVSDSSTATESINGGNPSNSLYVTDITGSTSLTFASTTDLVDLGSSISYDITYDGAISIAMWVRRDSASANALIMREKASAGYEGWGWDVIGGIIRFAFVTSLNTNDFIAQTTSSSLLPLGTWVHLGLVYNNTTARVYVNGIEQTIEVIRNTLTSGSFGGEYNLNIGNRENGAGTNNWIGGIDDVRIFNGTELTQAQFYTIAHGGTNPSTPTSWYGFDETTGASAVDKGSAGVTGVITGAIYSNDTPPVGMTVESISNAVVTDASTATESLLVYEPRLYISVSDSSTATESITPLKLSFVNVSDVANTSEGISYQHYYSLYFDGSSAKVDTMTMDFTRTAGQPMSAGAWFKHNRTYLAVECLMGVRVGSGSGDLWKIGSEATTGALSVDYDTTGGGEKVNTSICYYDDKWHNVIFTYDGSYIRIYVDGALVVTGNLKTTASIDQTAFAIGKRQDSGSEYFKGNLDNCFVSNQLLSATDVSNIYSGTYDPTKINHLWKFNEGSGSTANDSIGSLSGTIANATYSTDVPTNLVVFQPYLTPSAVESSTSTESVTIGLPQLYTYLSEVENISERIYINESEQLFAVISGRVWGVKII